jgi:hypothetical protein
VSTVIALALIVGLVLVDLLALRFGQDTRPDIGQLPDRWFGTR